jgi:hypothetical protein
LGSFHAEETDKAWASFIKNTLTPAQVAAPLPFAQITYSQFGEAINKRSWQDP